MIQYIQTFESLNSQEQDYFSKLKSYGFNIEFKMDTQGHLYMCRLMLPWHAIDFLNDIVKNKISKQYEYVFDVTINQAKSNITNKGYDFFQIELKSWKNNRDIDVAIEEFYGWFTNIGVKLEYNSEIRFRQHKPEELQSRFVKSEIDNKLNDLW